MQKLKLMLDIQKLSATKSSLLQIVESNSSLVVLKLLSHISMCPVCYKSSKTRFLAEQNELRILEQFFVSCLFILMMCLLEQLLHVLRKMEN